MVQQEASLSLLAESQFEVAYLLERLSLSSPLLSTILAKSEEPLASVLPEALMEDIYGSQHLRLKGGCL